MNHLDLFSGIGGFSIGLEKAGFTTKAFCEMDPFCKLVLKTHWKDVKIYDNIKELTGEQIEKEIGPIDIITGGFPCQPFSVAGQKRGTDDDRYLWPEMFRVIREVKPQFVIGENVKGLINLQDGMVFETVCADLESEGYEVRAFNIPAAGVGAPHRRERLWIVAHSEHYGQPASKKRRGAPETVSKQQEGKNHSFNTERTSGLSTSATNVADSESIGSRKSREPNFKKRDPSSDATQSNGSGADVSDSNSKGSQRFRTQHELRKSQSEEQVSWPRRWEFEPNVGRVAHGVSGRSHRLRGLGNAIVPQIAEEIGKAIMKVYHG